MVLEERKIPGINEKKLNPAISLTGFPVLTSAPTYDGGQGEIVLVDTGSSRSIYIYLNGAWYSSLLT